MAAVDDDDEYFVPLEDQRVFGAGIKRKRITFIPAATTLPQSQPTSDPTTVGKRYLSIVLQDKNDIVNESSQNGTQGNPEKYSDKHGPEPSSQPICEICRLPFQLLGTPVSPRPHEASIVHQVCLSHSHPPSDLDRCRKGLKYLTSYGWDPDSRLGLGAGGGGIRMPIKGKEKHDTVGLGVDLGLKERKKNLKKVEKLDAGRIRKREEVGRRKAERLNELFYRNGDVERYLGGS